MDCAWEWWVIFHEIRASCLTCDIASLDDFSTLCFVRADLSPLTASAQVMTGPGGKEYWTIVFSVEIHFGLTEFKARIRWNHDVCTPFRHIVFVRDILMPDCFPGENQIVGIKFNVSYTVK